MAVTTEKKYSGTEKAAMFMLAMPEDQAEKLFSMLHPDEIREISLAMSSLGSVPATAVENMLLEFARQISSTGSLIGTSESTERLLSKVLPDDQVSGVMEEIRGPAGRTLWDKLDNVNEEVLANYLKNEYPQTIAVVVSRLRPESAAKMMVQLPETLAMEVVNRMLKMEAVRKEILEDIENTLRVEFMSNLARSSRRDSHESVAEIFNFLDRSSEARFLKGLEERNAGAAQRIKNLMFTFEDLSMIDPGNLQGVIRGVDKDKLAMALKGSSEEVAERFFANMSERAVKLMRDDMDAMGMVRVRDVEDAQQYVVITAKDLAAKGEIFISSAKDSGDQLVG